VKKGRPYCNEWSDPGIGGNVDTLYRPGRYINGNRAAEDKTDPAVQPCRDVKLIVSACTLAGLAVSPAKASAGSRIIRIHAERVAGRAALRGLRMIVTPPSIVDVRSRQRRKLSSTI
jgi:hypothetical protein